MKAMLNAWALHIKTHADLERALRAAWELATTPAKIAKIAEEHIGRYECVAHIGGSNFYVQY